MRVDYFTEDVPGTTGVRVLVRLSEITEEEHVLFDKHRMLDLEIAGQTDAPTLTFGDFYGYEKAHSILLHRNSAYQAELLIQSLKKGFKQFEWFMRQNRRLVGVEPEPLPFNFFDSARFEHTWIRAESGWGKTSLLSALIAQDLLKVKDGECSLLIIDSQDEHLGQYLPHMVDFAPGGDLHGKLVYFEPDIEHPLALNIFDFERYHRLSRNDQLSALETAHEMLSFFIGATIGVPSGHMKNIIGFALRALALIPNATVFTFKELLVQGRLKNLMKEHKQLNQLDDAAKRFLLTDMFGGNYGPSVGAVASRLDAFDQNAYLQACFSQPKNKLNLYELLRESHVIVINTKESVLRDNMPIFGRYFLALLLGVVRTRTGGGLPCHCFIDEAWQYIAEEPIVANLIATARRQKIGFTFAQQFRSQISNALVNKALQTCGVQIEPAKTQYHWNVQVRKGELQEITPPYVNFEREPQMTPKHWQAIMDDMYGRFSAEPPRSKNDQDLPDAI
ncbi:hypothetical protein UNPF46_17625 [Bradyrhizobium sp. UNPF46]|uniref:hypothetical protein n=1 Tax=Bradyrhizobium sp. UNPF46 TaxID=1141168 RepID=UPI0011502D8B|nr:hypothetical protein [Bradyrhizobium sp. UNPF46]TQF37933.1 hypothetical protein UNPF46_17625 [Bradyrhizobium sp. UNPF46]